MSFVDRPVVFECNTERLVGVLSIPERHDGTGVVVVVGGPQYRVGSHRQFRHLARKLADCGVPVLRFDYRGMGDSEGEARPFDMVEADVRSAVDLILRTIPGLRHVVLWGLCDGASASLLGANSDQRIRGLILLNPWVRTEASKAATYLRHYYAKRLVSADFWQQIVRGEIGVGRAARGLLKNVRRVVDARAEGASEIRGVAAKPAGPLPDRLALAWERFPGPVGIVLSGDDMTAREFSDLCRSAPKWRRLMRRKSVEQRELAGANHTFSRREWREQVAAWTLDWIERWRVEFS